MSSLLRRILSENSQAKPDAGADHSAGYVLPGRREILIASVVSILLVMTMSLWIGRTERFNGDEYRYLMQAENPLAVVLPPHGLRILTPRLAWLMPISLRHGFYVITLLSLIGTVALAYLILRTIGCSIAVSATVLSMFILHRDFHESLFHYPLVDSFSFFLIELGILAAFLRKDGLFSFSLTVGILNRETSLFLIPVYHLMRWRKPFSPRALAATGLVCSGGIITLFLTRNVLLSLSDRACLLGHVQQFYPTFSGGFGRFDQFYMAEFREIVSSAERLREIFSFRTFTAGFGILAPFSLLGLVWGRREIRSLTVYLICVLIQPFFAHQVTRLVFFSFPFFLIAGGEAMRRLQRIPRLYQYILLSTLVLGKLVGRIRWPYELWAGVFLLAGFLCVVHFAGGGALRRFRKSSDTSGPTEPISPVGALRAGLSPVTAFLILMVTVNISLVYLSRPAPIGRLQEHFRDLQRVSGGYVDPDRLQYVGAADVRPISMDGILYDALFPSEDNVSVLLPMTSDIIGEHTSIIAVAVSYPRKESQLRVGIVSPKENGVMAVHQKQLRVIPFAPEQLEQVNTSLPVDLTVESLEDKFVYIGLDEDVALIDVFFFDCEMYLSCKRSAKIFIGEV